MPPAQHEKPPPGVFWRSVSPSVIFDSVHVSPLRKSHVFIYWLPFGFSIQLDRTVARFLMTLSVLMAEKREVQRHLWRVVLCLHLLCKKTPSRVSNGSAVILPLRCSSRERSFRWSPELLTLAGESDPLRADGFAAPHY